MGSCSVEDVFLLSAAPILLRSLRLRRRCWGRSASWKKRGRSWLRSDSSSISSCPPSCGRMRADWLSGCGSAAAALMRRLVSRGELLPMHDWLLYSHITEERTALENRPVWWEKKNKCLCSVVYLCMRVCVRDVRMYLWVNSIDIQGEGLLQLSLISKRRQYDGDVR